MLSLAKLIDTVLMLYTYVLIAWVIMTWLVNFNVVNTRNRLVYVVSDFLYRVTEPALRPIRRFVPNIGGVDITPLILMLIIYFARNLVFELLV